MVPRVTIVTPSLGAGGAERVLTTLATHWSEKHYEITIVCLTEDGQPSFYPTHSRTVIRYLGIESPTANMLEALIHNVKAILTIRTEIKASRPHVVLGFGGRTNILVLLATRGLGCRIFVAERTDPRMHQIGKVWNILRRLTYSWADGIIVQTRSVIDFYRQRFRTPVQVIPNPVMRISPDDTPAQWTRPQIVAMGRLDFWKGFDLLVDAFSKIADQHPKWHLTIFGEGPDRQSLQDQIDRLGLTERVHLPGRTRTPERYLANSDIFVLTSRYEGFPNVLCEAMAAGAAVVATDCPSGPSEIIRNGVDGILVSPNDAGKLASAIRMLMESPAQRSALGRAAKEIVDRFPLSFVAERWESFLGFSTGIHAK